MTLKLHYTKRGEGSPLILIMGLGADSSVWEEHVKAYEKHFTCYLIDNRGVGLSPKPLGPYTITEMAADVAALMEEVGIERASVTGISMGGAIAQCLAIDFPEKVSRLVLVSSWASCSSYMKQVFEHFKCMRATTKLEDFMMLLQLWIWSPDYVANNVSVLSEDRDSLLTAENPQPRQGFEGQCDACITHDTQDRLCEISVPTLVTVGDRDIFTPIECSELLAEKIPGARIEVFENAAHTHHWEALDRFNSVTTQFLLEEV